MTADSPASPPSPHAKSLQPRRLARLIVDVQAIAANWRHFRALAPHAVCAAVVKADGYGLGAARAATALAEAGARVFFTATFAEAAEVRSVLGPGPQIFVLNGPSRQDLEAFASLRLTPVLNSLDQISLWRSGDGLGRGPAALHIDTGMNRLGLGPGDIAAAAAALADTSLALIMSHLACASDPNHALNGDQRARFVDAAKAFPKAPLSLAATAGTLLGPPYCFDLIRPGIGLYGSGGRERDNPALAAAARIEAPIIQIRDITTGESAGYGATFVADKPMRAAIVAIGYADGFLRSFAGQGYGVLAGARAPVLGRVSMDLTILDVSDCTSVRVGDMVEFLGANALLDEVAAAAGTAPYEILTTFAGTVGRNGHVQMGQVS